MKPIAEALRSVLARYREQTVAVSGERAGLRFDADPEIAQVRAWIESQEWPYPLKEPDGSQ